MSPSRPAVPNASRRRRLPADSSSSAAPTASFLRALHRGGWRQIPVRTDEVSTRIENVVALPLDRTADVRIVARGVEGQLDVIGTRVRIVDAGPAERLGRDAIRQDRSGEP